MKKQLVLFLLNVILMVSGAGATCFVQICGQVNPACNGQCNGYASACPSGGVPPYTYHWSTSPVQAGQTATGLCAGVYTVTVTDAASCVATMTVTVAQPSPISTSISHTNVTCGGPCNGTTTINVSGGSPSYTYVWLPSMQTGQTVTGLCAGTYTCSVTDSHGCTAVNTVTITQASSITVVAQTTTNASCFNMCNGSALVSSNGGNPPYTYHWSPSGGNGTTATGLCSGTYTVTVTDANGCTGTATTTITQPAQLTAATQILSNVSCFNGNNGSARIIPSGGTLPYTYLWSPSGGNGLTLSNAIAGTYTVTLTDANGCTAIAAVTITQPPALTAVGSTIANVLCNGGCVGIVAVTAGGGTPTYTYHWSPSGQTGQTATNLCAGTYTITVTDSHGCTVTSTATVTQTTTLFVQNCGGTPIACYGGTGCACIYPSGGNPPYTYMWNTAPVITTATACGLIAGNYTATVSDINGCSATIAITMTQPAQLTLTFGFSNASCMTCPDGIAGGYGHGGTPAYTYVWTPTGGNNQTATGLLPGTYTCCVTDSHGCSTCSTVTVGSNCAIPTTQATNITFTNVTTNSATVNWINGNGSRRIVKIKPSNTFTAPVNGNDYTANPVYTGSGEQVVYNGTGSSVNVTGLSPGTFYWFRVYEANCQGNFSGYSSVANSGNPRRVLTQLPLNPNRPEADIAVQDEVSSFQIIPNPAHNSFTVSFDKEAGIGNPEKNGTGWELGIFDVTGREVYKQNNQSSTINFHLRAGVYFVKVSAGQKVYNRKLIVE